MIKPFRKNIIANVVYKTSISLAKLTIKLNSTSKHVIKGYRYRTAICVIFRTFIWKSTSALNAWGTCFKKKEELFYGGEHE